MGLFRKRGNVQTKSPVAQQLASDFDRQDADKAYQSH
jgi:hypothetical protein